MEIAESRSIAKKNNYGFYHGKPCTKCNKTVRYTASSNCRECHLSQDRATWKRLWYKSQAEAVKDKRLQRTYGIGLNEYANMYEEQNGKCAICDEKKDVLCVDHCHTTSKVRGLLCHQCNQAIGLLSDDIGRLNNAIRYLCHEA